MHRTDAPDYTTVSGKRRFKESPPPRSVVGKDIMNALQEEVALVVEGSGGTLAVSGSADETAGWGQLKAAIDTLITANTHVVDINSIALKDEGDNDLSPVNDQGKIIYNLTENIVNLVLSFQVNLSGNIDHMKFTMDGLFRPFGDAFDSHPAFPVGVQTTPGGSTWNPLADRYINCEWNSPNVTFVIGNAQVANLRPNTQSFSSGIQRVAINYSYRRVL